MNGGPARVHHTTRFDTMWPEEWSRLSQKKKNREEIAAWDEAKTRLQEARQKRRNFDVSSGGTEYLKVISEPRASNTRNMRGSLDAVYFQTGMLRQTEAMNVNKKAQEPREQNKTHVDHISEKGYVSDFYYSRRYPCCASCNSNL